MAKTTATKKTAAAKKPAAAKTTARATTAAPKAKPQAAKRKVTQPQAAPAVANIDWKQALIGGGIGAAVGGLVTKLVFLR